jgi:hypothetical protein
VFGPTLGVRLPRNPMEWINICGETGLYHARWVNGVEMSTHGYGIELIFKELTIDFAWGEAGEPDGFDVWRLWNFARLNPDGTPCLEHAEVRAWVAETTAAGELTQDRYLYYSPTRCPKCRIYFCFKCRRRVQPRDEQFQCMNQQCGDYASCSATPALSKFHR